MRAKGRAAPQASRRVCYKLGQQNSLYLEFTRTVDGRADWHTVVNNYKTHLRNKLLDCLLFELRWSSSSRYSYGTRMMSDCGRLPLHGSVWQRQGTAGCGCGSRVALSEMLRGFISSEARHCSEATLEFLTPGPVRPEMPVRRSRRCRASWWSAGIAAIFRDVARRQVACAEPALDCG